MVPFSSLDYMVSRQRRAGSMTFPDLDTTWTRCRNVRYLVRGVRMHLHAEMPGADDDQEDYHGRHEPNVLHIHHTLGASWFPPVILNPTLT